MTMRAHDVLRALSRRLAPFLILSLAVCLITTAQELTVADSERVLESLEEALPDWGERVLQVADGREWIEQLDFESVLKAVGEEKILIEDVPKEARRLEDKGVLVQLDRVQGKLRFASQERAWSFESEEAHYAVDETTAAAVVLDTLHDLWVPEEELGQLYFATQIVEGGPLEEEEAVEQFEMYRVVSIPRWVGDLPVVTSEIRAAVNNEGLLQRLKVDFPAFKLFRELKLRDREEVMHEALIAIMENDPAEDFQISAYLAYASLPLFAEAGNEDMPIYHFPVVVISVLSNPTPYQIIVAIARP